MLVPGRDELAHYFEIQAGRHVRGLPDELARAMLEQADHPLDLNEEIDGEVAL